MSVERRPLFFAHVMKTGGTTFFHHLRSRLGADRVYPPRDLDPRLSASGAVDAVAHLEHLSLSRLAALSPEQRERYDAYAGHFPYVARELIVGEPLTVTILRDPVERTISLLRQRVREITWVKDATRSSSSGDLALEEVYERPLVLELLVRDHQTKVFSMRMSDQLENVLDALEVDAARLAVAKSNLDTVDILGVTERYDLFLDEVDSRLGWRVQRERRANATPSAVRLPVSQSLRRRIAEDNAIDVELYEYARELVALRRRRRTAG